MIKILGALSICSVVVFAQTIQTKANNWNLVGTDGDITDISSVEFNLGDAIWQYDETDTTNPWKCYRHGDNYITDGVCEPISSLEAGSGFWIYSFYDSNITLNTTKANFEKAISDEWTLFCPVLSEYNITEIFNDTNITAVWGYDNNWTYADENNSSNAYSQIDVLKTSKGYWLYNPLKTTNYIGNQTILIGNDTTTLTDGIFQTVTKSTTDSVEDIWNISFKIDKSVDYSNFHIGIKFFKRESQGDGDGDDDIGEFVYRNVSLNSGNLTSPDMLVIYGTGDSASGGTNFSSSYDPNDMLSKSIVLNDNMLTLKLGLVMQNQSMVKESTFKVIEDYDVFITSNVPVILNSKPLNIEIINSDKYDFSNSNGIEGRIEIR